ncbi:nitroreductase family protein [Anaerocolumna sp. MB42-C2]|uniref:nitroreductase family protein n=1 Tax=Anaerocolumna sp. MB42-C2 TaxID=3070997 RepID=UPI0027E1B798|nr:nitroreductase family protein [Anaerocolumna sp. MB42-C2]WMJ85298.1 nitroreductase family protein [Anaerocolumna sp. MB42-C2]
MLNLYKTRRSIRKFQDKAIEQDKMEEILKGALMAPSSKGLRPWELLVVTDGELLQKLSESRGPASKLISGAAAGIVVLADAKCSDVWTEDASIIAIMIQLSAHSLGLGSCWVQVRERLTPQGETVDSYIKNLLGVPAKYKTECILALGYPAEEKESHKEADLPLKKIHFNAF